MMWKPYQKHYTNSYFFVLLVYCERWQPYSQPPPPPPIPTIRLSRSHCACGLSCYLTCHVSTVWCGRRRTTWRWTEEEAEGRRSAGEMFACLSCSPDTPSSRLPPTYRALSDLLHPTQHTHRQLTLYGFVTTTSKMNFLRSVCAACLCLPVALALLYGFHEDVVD